MASHGAQALKTIAPEGEKPSIDMDKMKAAPPPQVRDLLGDWSFGGRWQRPDAEMQAIWDIGVAETRAALEGPWAESGHA